MSGSVGGMAQRRYKYYAFIEKKTPKPKPAKLVIHEILGEKTASGHRAEAWLSNDTLAAASEAPTRKEANIALRADLRRRKLTLTDAAKKKLAARCA